MSGVNRPVTSLADEALLHVAAATRGRTAAWRIELGYALAGAVLIDLAGARRIVVRPGHVTVARPGRTGDCVQDEVLGRLALRRRGVPAEVWVERLAPHVLAGVQRRLVERGLLISVPGRGALPRRSPSLLPRGGRRASPPVDGALHALLRAARPGWVSGSVRAAAVRDRTDAPSPDSEAVALVCSAVATSVNAAAHRLMCGF